MAADPSPTPQDYEKAAQLWCLPTTSHLVMETELATAIASLLAAERDAEREANAVIAESGCVQVKKQAPYENYLEAWAMIRQAVADRIRARTP